MNDATTKTIETLATVRADRLCDAALATLAAGRRTFVKGKPVMVPWTDEKRRQLKLLQLDAFTPTVRSTQQAVADMIDASSDPAQNFDAAMTIYCAAGIAQVECRFGVA